MQPSSLPLPISEITLPGLPGAGLIGLAFAPGGRRRSALSIASHRDLGADLDRIAAWNAAAVVTLLSDAEQQELGIPQLGAEVAARFMEWHPWPIKKGDHPTRAFEQAWPARSAQVRGLLACGANVLIHDESGRERAAMVAARLLVEWGEDLSPAWAKVSAACPGARLTGAQQRWIAAGTPLALPAPATSPAAVQDRAIGALVGLALGDALGTTLEFSPKPTRAVLADLVGGGPFGLAPGEWTDDTAQALALADALLAHPDLDPGDLMTRFVAWQEHGAYSCTGTCFDIGLATVEALERYKRTGNPLAGSPHPRRAGNGALMRLAPVAIRHWQDPVRLQQAARRQTQTTHGAKACLAASEILAELLANAIAGMPRPELLASPAAERIEGGWRGLHRDAIRGSGYVVHTLQAAVWAVARATSFRSAVLLAANLGEDADTTAAVAGQLAGAIYGLSGLPPEWLERLAWRERIIGVAQSLFAASLRG